MLRWEGHSACLLAMWWHYTGLRVALWPDGQTLRRQEPLGHGIVGIFSVSDTFLWSEGEPGDADSLQMDWQLTVPTWQWLRCDRIGATTAQTGSLLCGLEGKSYCLCVWRKTITENDYCCRLNKLLITEPAKGVTFQKTWIFSEINKVIYKLPQLQYKTYIWL